MKKILLLFLTLIYVASAQGSNFGVLRDTSGNTVGVTSNKLDVHVAHTHFNLINKHLAFDASGTGGNTTLDTTEAVGQTVLGVAATTNFIVGDRIQISEGTVMESDYLLVTAVSAGVSLTVNRPIDNAYTTSATVKEYNIDLNLGTAGQSYRVAPPSDETWHLTRMIFSMTCTDATAPELAEFCNASALSNGLVVRTVKNGVQLTLTTWNNNHEIIEDMFDFPLTDGFGASNSFATGRWTWLKSGGVLLLSGATSDYLEILIQDTMSGSVDDLNVKIQGHVAD